MSQINRKSKLALDLQLVKRANEASFFDLGGALERQHAAGMAEIETLSLSDEEKEAAKTKLTELVNTALVVRASNPSWMVTGRGNLNVKKAHEGADKVANAEGRVGKYLKELKEKSRQNTKKTEQAQVFEKIKEADSCGVKEFEFNGTIFYKKRTTWHTRRA